MNTIDDYINNSINNESMMEVKYLYYDENI